MARQRRGGSGFRGPELRGTLGTLLRTTLQQAGVVRDVIERGAREGRSRLDDFRSNRRRTDVLAELGQVVLELIRDGEIDLDELPEARKLVRTLDEMDQADPDHSHSHHGRGHDHHHDHGDHDHDHGDHGHDDHDGHDGHHDDRPPTHLEDRRSARPAAAGSARGQRPREDELAAAIRPATRQRFDDRPSDARRDRTAPRSGRDAQADGTVPSDRWAPPRRASPAASRVWRPPVDDEAPPEAASEAEATSPRRPMMPPNPHRKGGISFDADDDLAEYMHPDDVPPKTRPDGES